MLVPTISAIQFAKNIEQPLKNASRSKKYKEPALSNSLQIIFFSFYSNSLWKNKLYTHKHSKLLHIEHLRFQGREMFHCNKEGKCKHEIIVYTVMQVIC